MNRDRIERELRERLESMETYDGWGRLSIVEEENVVSALLPWIMEVVEEADSEGRMDAGRLP